MSRHLVILAASAVVLVGGYLLFIEVRTPATNPAGESAKRDRGGDRIDPGAPRSSTKLARTGDPSTPQLPGLAAPTAPLSSREAIIRRFKTATATDQPPAVKPVPVRDPETGIESDPGSKVATTEQTKAEQMKALVRGRKLGKTPPTRMRVDAAACSGPEAQQNFAQLSGPEREQMRRRCAQFGFRLTEPEDSMRR